jgi:hypothetical protein
MLRVLSISTFGDREEKVDDLLDLIHQRILTDEPS